MNVYLQYVLKLKKFIRLLYTLNNLVTVILSIERISLDYLSTNWSIGYGNNELLEAIIAKMFYKMFSTAL